MEPRTPWPWFFFLAAGRNELMTPKLIEAMHKLADREIKAGRMLDSGGLTPLAMGAQVRIANGQLSVLDGPFVEAKEVIGGYAIFELQGKEEAVASANLRRGGGSISALWVTGDPAKGDPGGEAPRPRPHPPHLLG